MSAELPQGWAATTLGEICSKPQYGWTCSGAKIGRIKYLRTTDISDGGIDWDSVPYCEEAPEDFEKYRVTTNDILVSRAGSVGVSLRITDVPCDAVFASYLIRFKPLNGVPPKYVEFFLKSDSYWHSISEFSAGIAVPNVNASKLASLELPLAPSAEQRRIVAKLEALLGKVDASQQRLAKISVLLKRFRQSVLATACSGRLTADWREENPNLESASETLQMHARRTLRRERNTRRMKPAKGLTLLDYSDEFPTTWAWLKVRELVEKGAILDVQDGNHGELYPRSEDFGNAGVPYISAEHVTNNRVQIAAAPLLKSEKAQHLRIGFARANDVILTHNATVGRVALLPPGSPDVVLSTSTTYYRVDEAVLLASYLATFLRSHYFQRQLEAVMEQTTRNQVSVTKQVEFGIAVPPLPEQEEIVRRVEALFALADQIEARYVKARAHVNGLTPSILARAFRGELVPQDPNDEPASVLLERIKQQREQASSKKSSKRQQAHVARA